MTAEEVRQSEAQCVEQGTSIDTLMEKAGTAVANYILEKYKKQAITVVCGPGNNGGDGYVVARQLQEKGWPIKLVGALQKNPPRAVSLWQGDILDFIPENIDKGSLIVDAIFGTGLERNIEGHFKAIIERINQVAAAIVSIDLPSGIHTDTAEVLGLSIKSSATVTFNFRKPAHVLLPGREYVGDIHIADIGINLPTDSHKVYVNRPGIWKGVYPFPNTKSHKYDRGFIHIYGGEYMTGAARLAAAAARRMGAGMVMIESLAKSHEIYEAENIGVLTKTINSAEDFGGDPRVSCALIGPGSGRTPFIKELVFNWLKKERPTLLDADALYVFSDYPSKLFNSIKSETVLTPHEGEFARIFSTSKGKLKSTQQAARDSNSTVLLKGADTVIADPTGYTLIQDHSSSYLATGGTGDVLAGMIAALLGQGVSGLAAAGISTWVHSASAEKIGLGLIAEDIPDVIPYVLKEILDYA